MKKSIKTLLLTLLLAPTLVACGGSKDPGETRTEEEIIIENAAIALGQVGITYNNFSTSAGITKDTTLIDKVNVDGYNFTFAYTVEALLDYGTNNWVKVEGCTLKVTVPEDTQLPAENKSFAAYKLKGAPTFAGYDEDFVAPKGLTITDQYIGTTYTGGEWNIRVNAMKTLVLSIAELYTNTALKSDKTRVITYGVYAGSENHEEMFNAASNKFCVYFDDGDYSLATYDNSLTELPDLVIGQKYKITGVFSNYYDTIQIKNPVYELAEDADVEPGRILKIDSTNGDLMEKSHASRKCEVTGVVTAVEFTYADTWQWQTSKANVRINVTGATENGSLKSEGYAYVHQFDHEDSYASWANSGVKVGDTVTFIGRAYWYSGVPAFYVSTLTNLIAA
jgi:hypothetical protein